MGLIKIRDINLVKIENTKVNNYFKKRGFDYKVNFNGIKKILIECINEDNVYRNQIKLFIEYVIENKININLNKKNEKGDYLINIVCMSYSELIELLINYANKNNNILKLNVKSFNGNYPLLVACAKNNIGMVQLFIDYGNKNNIIL